MLCKVYYHAKQQKTSGCGVILVSEKTKQRNKLTCISLQISPILLPHHKSSGKPM